ncbi:PD-(D/E)XK motif protein [Rhodococcus sp. As11]
MTVPVVANGREVVQAVDNEGQHHLLIPADTSSHPENTRSPLAMSFRDFRFGPGSGAYVEGRYLDIHCQLPALNKQFDKVIGEIVGAVDGATRPVGAAAAVLASWRRLFSTLADARVLTHQEKLAAFGELSVLRELVDDDADFRVVSWTGPEQEPHDFELKDASIEVKSVGVESDTIRVHGLAQLDEVEEKRLFLIVRQVTEDSSGRTVSELLGEILATCDDPTLLRERAARLGVHEAMEDTTRFAVTESLIGEVAGDFPRITAETLGADLAETVTRVGYELRLKDIRWRLATGSVEAIRNDVR